MSVTIDILSVEGKPATSVVLPARLFEAQVNVPLIHQVVVAQLAAARQGTHATKTRGQVSGGGAKPWRQKGTGRARQGSRRAPQWTGGGTVFGPQPRSYAQKTPKKMIAAALCSALSDRVADGRLFVLDAIVTGDAPSTRQALEALSVIGTYDTAIVVLHRDEDLAWLSLRNVANVHALAVDQLNAYDVVANQMVVFTKPALEDFVTRFGIAGLEELAPEAAEEPAKPAKAKKAKKVEAATEAPEAAEASEAEAATEAAEPTVATEATEEPAKPARAKKAKKADAEPVAEAEADEEESK